MLTHDGHYRYTLHRHFSYGPTVLFVALNPSTADAHTDDPTIRRCTAFARRWGYGTLLMANLYAWRATNPKDLNTTPDPIGPNNDHWLKQLAANTDRTIAAWGAWPGPNPTRPTQALKILGPCLTLGHTKNGSPRHPLYVRADTEPITL